MNYAESELILNDKPGAYPNGTHKLGKIVSLATNIRLSWDKDSGSFFCSVSDKKVFNLFWRQSLDSGKTEVYFNDGVSKIDMIIAFEESHENSRSRSHNKLDRLFLANIFSQA